MISDKKEPKFVNREIGHFFEALNYLKEKTSRIIFTVVGLLLATGIAGTAFKSFFLRNTENLVILKTFIIYLVCFISIIVVSYFVWRKKIYPRIKLNTGIKDDREFKYADEHPYGTARPNTAEDLDDILEFKDIENTNGIILGYDSTINKVVSIPTQQEFSEKANKRNWTQKDKTNNNRNRNILVIGSPGTMKSRAIIMNQILQAMKAGESIIITDPKGELYEKTYSLLKENGYDAKMFNLVNQEHSDAWNPIHELNGDSTYAKIFAETVVNNANEAGEQYWNDNAMNFFKACIMFNRMDSFGKMYDFISGNTLVQFENLFSSTDELSVARRAYNIFHQCSDQVKGQIINGLGIMIDVFQDEKVRNITNTSEMDMTKPAREKCAYFVITSDQHRTFDYLAVLFWTMAFIKLIEYIDKHRDEKGDPTTLPVHLLLDEFPNIGAIPDFNRKLSTVRSRLLYSTIVIQNIPQLMNRYPNGMHEEIFSDCDFVVFLGCNDNTTAEYISKLTGIASIEVMTQNHVYDNSQLMLNQSVEMREVKSIGQRTVMNPDEVRSILNTDLLLFIRGTKSVYKCEKFDYSQHPFSKNIKISKIENHIPDWMQKQIDEENERIRIAEERRITYEAEEKRKAEILRKAKEKDEAEKRAKKETLEAEKNNWLNQMNSQQIDFENLSAQLSSETISETEETFDFSNEDVEQLSVTDNAINGLFDDTDALLASMKPQNKTLSRKKRKIINIDDVSEEKTSESGNSVA